MITIQELYALYLQHGDVQTDTRKLTRGSIFFALKGENYDGNKYALKAIEDGAAYAIVDDMNLKQHAQCLWVEDVLEALQALALFHRQQLSIPVLAITGSNGKTTTKELLACVLAKKYNVLATKGNLNNHIGVPLTLLSIKPDHEFAIIEMGANHQLEIEAYCKWVLPSFGLINNCGKAHLEGFGGIEGVRKGKGELYDFIRLAGGIIFRNADFDYLEEMANGIVKQITYGEYKGDLKGKIYEHEPFLKIAIVTNKMEQIISTQLMGDYNLYNILAAVSVGTFFGVVMDDVKAAIADYIPDNNRSEHRLVKGINIILDAYNANPTSMLAALDSFNHIQQSNKIVILGSMMELGTESQQEHEHVLDYAMQYPWKKIITVGNEFLNASLAHDILHFDTVAEAKEWFWKNVTQEDWVYLKGSRKTAMEKIIE